VARPGAIPAAARARLDADGFEIAIGGEVPLLAAYRDIASLLPGPNSLLLVLGEGPDATRVVLEQLGSRLASLVAELRERRTRQRLSDALVQLDADPIPVVEYRLGGEHGVAQVALHAWGAEVVPFDEALAPRRIRRAGIGSVETDAPAGLIRVRLVGAEAALELPGLGAAATAWGQRFEDLRNGALRDAATLVAGLLPDAPFAVRQRLAGRLVDGRPASAADLGSDLDLLDAAVLTEPVFAASFRELLARGDPLVRWFAMAPERPGSDQRRAWYLLGLPGNLLALELVSEGAHATYLFRVVPRATYRGEGPDAIAAGMQAAAVEISNALVDARFLRQPMALPPDQLANARHLRDRLALAAIPTLAAARRRFVARLVHDDPARWGAALDALLTWHAAARDDSIDWPGRAAEEVAAGEADPQEVTTDAGL
jgi:hypothetical protein